MRMLLTKWFSGVHVVKLRSPWVCLRGKDLQTLHNVCTNGGGSGVDVGIAERGGYKNSGPGQTAAG